MAIESTCRDNDDKLYQTEGHDKHALSDLQGELMAMVLTTSSFPNGNRTNYDKAQQEPKKNTLRNRANPN